MRREERVTVQGPRKEITTRRHVTRGGGGVRRFAVQRRTPSSRAEAGVMFGATGGPSSLFLRLASRGMGWAPGPTCGHAPPARFWSAMVCSATALEGCLIAPEAAPERGGGSADVTCRPEGGGAGGASPGMHWKGRDLGGGPRGGQTGGWRRLPKRLGAVTVGYMPLSLAFGVTGTVAEHRLGALEAGGGSPPFQCIPGPAPPPPPPWPRRDLQFEGLIPLGPV